MLEGEKECKCRLSHEVEVAMEFITQGVKRRGQ